MHLRIIAPHPSLDFMFPVSAEPYNAVLARSDNKQCDHLACARKPKPAYVRHARKRNVRDASDGTSRKRMRTEPEALQAVACAKGKRDAEREGENIVCDHVEGRADVVAALSTQHAPA